MEIISANLKQYINFKPLNWNDAIDTNPNLSLIIASKHGNLDKIKKSIRNGGMTTNIGLHYCTLYNHIECTKYLLSIGSNFQNKRSIHKIIEKDNVEILKTIFEYDSIVKKYFSINLLINEFYSLAHKYNSNKCIETFKSKFDNLNIYSIKYEYIPILDNYDLTKKMLIKSVINNDIENTHLLIASGYNLDNIILDKTVDFEVREYLKCYW
tara:strand:- start:46384 stop:47016 length:633 start_codon:yes stop_codon:yes gene_type:complete